jgi:hypothetical protein
VILRAGAASHRTGHHWSRRDLDRLRYAETVLPRVANRVLSAGAAIARAYQSARPKCPVGRGAPAVPLSDIARRCTSCNPRPSRVGPSLRSARRSQFGRPQRCGHNDRVRAERTQPGAHLLARAARPTSRGRIRRSHPACPDTSGCARARRCPIAGPVYRRPRSYHRR